jgi:hypothetical protein
MTNLIGLRLAYRGFVTGLAAGYVWLATAMGIAALIDGDPLAPLQPFARSVLPSAGDGSQAAAFVLGFALVQLGSALIGMLFSYFFGRFFTIRRTLAAAAPCFALLAWALLATLVGRSSGQPDIGTSVAPLLATLAYGVLLGAGLPVRADVARYPTPASASGSPVT